MTAALAAMLKRGATPDDAHTATETGLDRLWVHVERAHRLWSAANSPGWDRLGLAVTRDQQTLFVDTAEVCRHRRAANRAAGHDLRRNSGTSVLSACADRSRCYS
jgi:hypothetical protein